MTPKRIPTAALLAFVAASLARIVVKEVRQGSGGNVGIYNSLTQVFGLSFL